MGCGVMDLGGVHEVDPQLRNTGRIVEVTGVTDKGRAVVMQKKAYELTKALEECAEQLVQPFRSASECIQTRRRLAEALRNVVAQYGEHEEPTV